jgi:hypothetical protein
MVPNSRILPDPAQGSFGPTQPEPEVCFQICYTYLTEVQLRYIQVGIKPDLFKGFPYYHVINTCVV